MAEKKRMAGGTGKYHGVLPIYPEHVVYKAEEANYGADDIER
jgi:hypothetical protein